MRRRPQGSWQQVQLPGDLVHPVAGADPAPPDPFLLPESFTRRDAGQCRALDQPLAAAGLRAELLECCLTARNRSACSAANERADRFGLRPVFRYESICESHMSMR